MGYNKVVLEIRINKNTDARGRAEQDVPPKRERKEMIKSVYGLASLPRSLLLFFEKFTAVWGKYPL